MMTENCDLTPEEQAGVVQRFWESERSLQNAILCRVFCDLKDWKERAIRAELRVQQIEAGVLLAVQKLEQMMGISSQR